jgi:hypothetical protein
MERLDSLGEVSPLTSLLSTLERVSRTKNASTAIGRPIAALSPRFAPIIPKSWSKQQNRFLSPTILSFYRDSSAADNIASIPDVMDTAGITADDQARTAFCRLLC